MQGIFSIDTKKMLFTNDWLIQFHVIQIMKNVLKYRYVLSSHCVSWENLNDNKQKNTPIYNQSDDLYDDWCKSLSLSARFTINKELKKPMIRHPEHGRFSPPPVGLDLLHSLWQILFIYRFSQWMHKKRKGSDRPSFICVSPILVY